MAAIPPMTVAVLTGILGRVAMMASSHSGVFHYDPCILCDLLLTATALQIHHHAFNGLKKSELIWSSGKISRQAFIGFLQNKQPVLCRILQFISSKTYLYCVVYFL
jgi:hypothetical protein